MKRFAITLLLGLTACAAFLGVDEMRRSFPHRAHVTSGVGCPECHAGISVAADDGPLHLPNDASCVACHREPHDARPCLGCHGDSVGPQLIATRQHLRFSHVAHSQNKIVDCMRCHEGVATEGRPLLPKMASCLECHVDGMRPERCADCHLDLVDESVRPESHLTHGLDYLQRHGADAGARRELCRTCHVEADCARCHGVSTPSPSFARALGTPLSAKIHAAGFVARHGLEARAQPGTCATCHQPETCQSCHTSKAIAAQGVISRGPHPENWVGALGENRHGAAARLDPLGCASCHGGAGEALCVGCHKVGGVGGSIHPLGWSSQKRTSELPCRLCHLPGAR
jgi:hypothetical protein